MIAKRGLALFDFDGTITSRDSLWLFLRHSVKPARLLSGAPSLVPWLVIQNLKSKDRDRAKARVLSQYFLGWSRERLQEAGRDLARKVLPAHVRPEAVQRIQWHQAQGHRTLIVSASAEEWVGPWAADHRMECLCTRLAYDDRDCFTGEFSSPNCKGPEKVRRLKEKIPDWEAHTIFAYGDSDGDREMLALADRSYYRPFRKGKD